jgi:hypothetical protein
MCVVHAAGALNASFERSTARSLELHVKNFEHSSIDHAKKSCDPICLRVKRKLKFGCSISWSNKQRSITELNSDSHSKQFIVKNSRRQSSRTLRSCGSAPSAKSPLSSKACQARSSLQSAGFPPAFLHRASSGATAPAFFRPALLVDARRMRPRASPRAWRRAEFISVSGFCADRSALRSDLRLKRTSGPAAATVLPRAPMNSPGVPLRVSFSSQSIQP